MCCAVLLLMVPIVSLPLVFGGVRAQPIAQEIQSAAWALPAGDVTCQGEEVLGNSVLLASQCSVKFCCR